MLSKQHNEKPKLFQSLGRNTRIWSFILLDMLTVSLHYHDLMKNIEKHDEKIFDG